MRVAATRVGFYVKLHQPGEEFDIPAELVSKNWMRAVEAPAEPVVVAETPAEVPAVEPVAVEAAPGGEPVKPRRGRRPKVASE
jgi:hypothetical protein